MGTAAEWPLREAEMKFKQIYLKNGFTTEEKPMDYADLNEYLTKRAPEYRDLLSIDVTDSLNEEHFFGNGGDLAAVQHYRYMPAMYHTHAFFEMAIVLDGSFVNFVGNTRLTLTKGDIMILGPATRHAVSCFSDDGILINVLIRKQTFDHHFTDIFPENDLLNNFFMKTLYNTPETPYLLFKTGGDPQLESYAKELLEESQGENRYKNAMMTSLLSIFLVNLLRHHEKDVFFPGYHASTLNADTVFILKYIQTNYATVTLNQLSSFFNYSERQLQRIIVNATGQNFRDTVKKLRMHHAAELLSSSQMSIADIGNHLGYYDTSSFRHHFKDYYQCTPQEYREQHKP